MTLYSMMKRILNGLHKLLVAPFIRHSFAKCGAHVSVPRNTHFSGIENIHIGNRVALGSGLTILSTRARVMIGDDVMFGAGAIILKGVQIGENAVVAAGSVVIHNVESNTIVAGVPAKEIKKYE